MSHDDNPLVWLFGAIGRRGKLGGAITGTLAFLLTAIVLLRGLDGYAPGTLLRIFGFLGVLWLLTFALFLGANVWKQDKRFTPMKLPDLLAAMPGMKRPFFVCLDCKLLLPFEVSVGTCPRCESTSSCLEVAKVEDLAMVRNSLGQD